ncbi:hypothetical protein L2725_19715 [Shewanella corallii]|uniref:Uncharacterized protein n=1 Tax=Shewanella corallii TaxID=560080 RepID=A0ABT0NC76_9GAMM|nr:hypothetical protein [Shewanella corallii]MCL2915975.1 hypothetical protein [Shewanella corallii]
MTALTDYRASGWLIVSFLLLFSAVSMTLGMLQGEAPDLSGRSLLSLSAQCEIPGAVNSDMFVVHIPEEALATPLLDKLCQNPVIVRQFGAVEVVWGYKVSDALEFLGKGLADLVMTNENIMQALMGEPTHNYHPILQYPSYSAFLLSNKEKPLLEKSYYIGKTLGLLSSPTSRSGHILPKRFFNTLGLDVDELDIRYASSHAELRNLLAAGEVDIISTYWQEADEKAFSRNYITPIRENISGARWYLKLAQRNTDLVCAVQDDLISLSLTMNGYFRDVTPVWQCESPEGQ